VSSSVKCKCPRDASNLAVQEQADSSTCQWSHLNRSGFWFLLHVSTVPRPPRPEFLLMTLSRSAWQTLRLPDVNYIVTDSVTRESSPAVVFSTPNVPKLDNPPLGPTVFAKPLHSTTPSPTKPPTPSSTHPATFDPYDHTKVAFLVETRPLAHLPALFAHMMSVIPAEWTFRFMGGPQALDFMRANPLLSQYEKSGKLSFLQVPSNYSMKDRDTISQMFTDPHLYADILAPAEHLLVFQPDSIFCAGAPKSLNDFLEYDWIGAPWSKTAGHGGNGGLSLRKVSRILQVLEKKRRVNTGMPFEDEWLSNELNALPGARMAVADISKTFSVESVWDEAPLGYHIGWMGVHHPQVCLCSLMFDFTLFLGTRIAAKEVSLDLGPPKSSRAYSRILSRSKNNIGHET
jgi:hypothetical protein